MISFTMALSNNLVSQTGYKILKKNFNRAIDIKNEQK